MDNNIEKLAKKSNFKVLRKAKVIVSTRRLEEEGIETLIKQYGKSTINDFLGKRTEAEELDYTFDHGKERLSFLSILYVTPLYKSFKLSYSKFLYS